ncbi:hypothetical protein [Polaribacter sp. Hel1_85]|uniref:hypothetical protein n=1 Tax=Polaribacter sp. Hel1_85 TaxID=1250005 RepID=UPI00052E078F|nr:hypothetical protein [Polaribacter sp. Hel1_85]KGL62337.1 hypothetical protein PHEL85_2131 [Polaribacter sp. Hel1_85]
MKITYESLTPVVRSNFEHFNEIGTLNDFIWMFYPKYKGVDSSKFDYRSECPDALFNYVHFWKFRDSVKTHNHLSEKDRMIFLVYINTNFQKQELR